MGRWKFSPPQCDMYLSVDGMLMMSRCIHTPPPPRVFLLRGGGIYRNHAVITLLTITQVIQLRFTYFLPKHNIKQKHPYSTTTNSYSMI